MAPPAHQLTWYRDALPLKHQRVVDVGASVGELSQFFHEAGEGTSSVLSIEPLDENVARLRERIAAAGAEDSWRVAACAVSSTDGERLMRVAEESDGLLGGSLVSSLALGPATRRVPARRLSVLAPDATVVKVDIEGHEYEVIAEALPRLPDVVAWAIECHQVPGHTLPSLLGALAAHGHELLAASRRPGDASGAWVSAPIPPTLSWDSIPAGRSPGGQPFRMLHLIARRPGTHRSP